MEAPDSYISCSEKQQRAVILPPLCELHRALLPSGGHSSHTHGWVTQLTASVIVWGGALVLDL